jgi:hypothetical protein
VSYGGKNPEDANMKPPRGCIISLWRLSFSLYENINEKENKKRKSS